MLDGISTELLITILSIVIIVSFIFNEISRKTNVPSVLLLVVLGIAIKYIFLPEDFDTQNLISTLSTLGTVGLIMIVLEASLELELDKNKIIPITKALIIALIGLVGSAFAAAYIIMYFIEGTDLISALIYATPLAILSSAIIIPSVNSLRPDKKEFHIYESTFSDILGIMMFYFLKDTMLPTQGTGDAGGVGSYGISILLTVIISFVASYIILLIFQNIRSHVKLFLLISVLMLLYGLGKMMHLSSLLIILIFGIMMANTELFFKGPLAKFLKKDTAKHIYEGLHVITLESSFVVRTLFFVEFGMTITLASLVDSTVVIISLAILLSIFLIRWMLLRVMIGKDLIPQLYIAPRGLITILLFYSIPKDKVFIEGFSEGILLFVILSTGIIMTISMIYDKRRSNAKINQIKRSSPGIKVHEVSDVELDEPSPIY